LATRNRAIDRVAVMDSKRSSSSGGMVRRWARALLGALVLFLCAVPGIPVPQASALAGGNTVVTPSIEQQPKPAPQPAPVTPLTTPPQLRFRHITDEVGMT